MSRLDERCASACTAANQTANAILEQQRRLAEEFELTRLHTNCLLEATGRFERILSGVLASVDWRGPQQRIFEALPHLDPICSFMMLRTVLARLDVRLIPIERRPTRLSMDELPCLVVQGEDDYRVFEVGATGAVEVCDLPYGTRKEANLSCVSGRIYLIRIDKTDHASAGFVFGGFVGEVLERLRGPLIRIATHSAAINALGVALSLYMLLVYDLIITTGSLDTLACVAIGRSSA